MLVWRLELPAEQAKRRGFVHGSMDFALMALCLDVDLVLAGVGDMDLVLAGVAAGVAWRISSLIWSASMARVGASSIVFAQLLPNS